MHTCILGHMTPFGKSIVAVLIVGILGSSAYFVNYRNKIPVSPATDVVMEEVAVSTSTVSTSTAPYGKKMPFSQFMQEDNASYLCNLSQNIDGVTTMGIVYISNGKLRGEFTNTQSGNSRTSYMVIRDGYSYAWSTTSSSTGIKAKTTGNDGAIAVAITTNGSSNWNPGLVGDYTCRASAVSSSTFSLPETIMFAEVTR